MTALQAPEREAPPPLVAPRVVSFVWGALLVGLGTIPVLYAFISPRPFTSGPSPLAGLFPASLRPAVASASSLAVVALVGAIVVMALPVARRLRHGGGAVLAGVLFGGASIASVVLNGSTPGVGVFALPLAILAIGLFPRPPLRWYERGLLLVLRFQVWGSLAAALAVPAWALKHGYGAGVPGLTTRLAGVTPHPNALGPLAVALVVLEWRREPRHRPAVAVALVALVWTQSKTSWAALGLIAGIALVGALRRRAPARSVWPVVVLAGVIGASAYVALGLAGEGQDTDKREVSTETFTGRTAIWEVTLEAWQERPLIGHGAALWNDQMDRRYRYRVGFPPGHAHNQLIQTLGQAGLLGAVPLVVFLAAFAALARRADAVTRGVAGSLFLVLIVRCFSEPPLQSVVHGVSFFLSMATFGYVLIAANEAADDR